MFSLRQANESDRLFWQSLVPHISEKRFEQLLKTEQSYTLFDDETPVGACCSSGKSTGEKGSESLPCSTGNPL